MTDTTSGRPDADGTRRQPTLQPVEFDPFAEVPAVRSYPLTPAQREVYAALQMGPDARCAFNLCYALHLAGPLSAVSMRQAMQQVTDRHAALRMCIASDGESQLVHDSLSADLPHVDLSGLEAAGQRQALAELEAQETSTPFDVHTAPLWRAQVLSWSSDRHTLILTVHHLACDGLSSTVLFGDLAKAYAADRFGTAVQWPPALPYEDYLELQARPDRVEQQRSATDYWKARHTPPAAPLQLPADHARPALKTYACRTAQLALEPSLGAAVRQLGARHGCTPFVTLLAVFQGLIARLSGSSDIVVGVPMAAQTLLDNAHVVAHGAHTVPLRVAVDVDLPFAEQLAVVRRAVLDAQAHQQLTFGNLVRELDLPRDPSRTPLVDVLFNVDRIGAPFDFGELKLERTQTPKAYTNSELWLDVLDDGHALTLNGSCRASLFDAATLQRWLQAYRQALLRLVADPALPLALAYAPAGEERALLDGFNATRQPYPDHVRLEALVQRQAEATPHAVALWCEDRCVSYAQLEEMANGVAYALQAEGVLAGDRVGLFTDRHERMVAGVLGILKAGAAYVPLDPAFPAERMAFMAEHAGLRLILDDARTATAWPDCAVQRLRLETCPSRPQAPAVQARAADAAYVIYTSGSTGRPKGVAVRHCSVVNFVSSVARVPGLGCTDRMAAVATLSFDMSVFDLFAPLSVGAGIVLVARDEAQDGQALSRRLADSGATVMQATASTWRLLLDAGWHAQRAFRAFCGGEPLPAELARALQQCGAEVWNFYGPTETTVYSTCGLVQEVSGGVRVGRPIANTKIHVLDAAQRPLLLGAVGEICIAGDGVAIGYWGQRDLTAERFVPDPDHAGRAMYRTGDLGRWHADGSLECLGRTDHQVKLRGYRIELGEIEACLLRQPGIRQALVTVYSAAAGNERLVAYVVSPDGMPGGRALREAVRRQLPDYMVPAQIVGLPALPLLPNGKIDRRALPPPETVQPAPLLGAEPLTPREARVAAIWCRLLGVQQVLPSDNFFDLGGHSLLAARASQEMREALGHPVGVPRLVMETLSQLTQPAAGADDEAQQPLRSAREGGWFRRWAGGLRRT